KRHCFSPILLDGWARSLLRTEAGGKQRGRAADDNLGAHRRQGPDVGAGDAAVLDIADDDCTAAAAVTEAGADSVKSEERLRRVGVSGVAGVDDGGLER